MTPMRDEGHGPADWTARLAAALRARGGRLVSAESCTGGGVAAACTDLPGSSDWFERGLVTYSNAAKTELLGVPDALLAAHGAVSLPVARAMAEGALRHGGAACSLAITGIAGPGGGSPAKPVGLVCFAWRLGPLAWDEACHFDGDRAAVRRQAGAHALRRLVEALEAQPA
jgi:nicotinamide-nucleotide amidase